MELELCRICGGFQNLKSFLDEDSEMIIKLLVCANINIHRGDLLPRLICAQCDEKLELCYRLRKQSEDTQKRLTLEIQRKQRVHGSKSAQEASALNRGSSRDHSDYEQVDLSQYSEDINASEMEENCSKKEVSVSKQVEQVDLSQCSEDSNESGNMEVNCSKEVSVSKKVEQVDLSQYSENSNESGNMEVNCSKKEVLVSKQIDQVDLSRYSENSNEIENMEVNCSKKGSFSNKVQQVDLSQYSENSNGSGKMEVNCSKKEVSVSNFSCENIIKEVSEIPIGSEYCSIDLLSSSESSNECCNDLENDHAKKTLTDVNTLTGSICNEVFTEKKGYRSHAKQHGLERYKCKKCLKFFPSRSSLSEHFETHKGTFHQCPYCNRKYRALYTIKRHIKSAHSGEKSWECGLCNISFSRHDSLKRHLKLHSDEKKYKCSICSQSFKIMDYLHAHYKSCHNSDPDASKHQCGYCGKMFKALFTYKNHLLIHTNEKPYNCDSCNKQFRTVDELTIHQCVHNRILHKVYTLNEFDNTYEADGGISINGDMETEKYNYINTVANNNEIDKHVENVVNAVENHQDVRETSTYLVDFVDKPYVESCTVSDSEPIAGYEEIHSINFIQSQESDEAFLEQNNDSEDHIIEQKVDIVVTEQTKFISSVYNASKME